MNITLLGLAAARCSLLSPFVTKPVLSKSHMFTAAHVRLSHQLGSFLFTNSPHPALAILHSDFSHFLRSCIVIESVTVIGASGQSASAVNVSDENFECVNTAFHSNTAQLFGAAICVTSLKTIKGNITGTTFRGNKATMGGAVYFCALESTLIVENSRFDSNTAQTGAHLFMAKATTMTFTGTEFMFAQGRSSIQFAAQAMSPTFDNCKFFGNNASLLFMANSNPSFTRCCFVNYGEGPSFAPITDKFFDTTYGAGSKYTFTDCAVNFKTLTKPNVLNEELANALKVEGYESQWEYCRIVPLPTPTVDVSWKLLAAKEAIVAICAFALVSIIGIVLVACGCCRSNVNWDVTEESESSAKLEDVPKE